VKITRRVVVTLATIAASVALTLGVASANSDSNRPTSNISVEADSTWAVQEPVQVVPMDSTW
jgi:hypothetical protein